MIIIDCKITVVEVLVTGNITLSNYLGWFMTSKTLYICKFMWRQVCMSLITYFRYEINLRDKCRRLFICPSSPVRRENVDRVTLTELTDKSVEVESFHFVRNSISYFVLFVHIFAFILYKSYANILFKWTTTIILPIQRKRAWFW